MVYLLCYKKSNQKVQMLLFLAFYIVNAHKSSKCSAGTPIIVATKGRIDHGEFSECSEFTGSLIIPKSIQIIGNHAFYKCTGFDSTLTIPDSVISIGNYAFAECSGFKGTLTIPDSVTKIGEYAFYKCSGFTNLQFETSSLQTINKYVFAECTGFKGILTIPEYLLKIEDFAFSGCSGFNGLDTSHFITHIGNSAFNGCALMTGTLTIPKYVKSIGTNAFSATIFTQIIYNGQSEPNCTDSVGLGGNQVIEVKSKYQSTKFCRNSIKIKKVSQKVTNSSSFNFCESQNNVFYLGIIATLSLITIVEFVILCKKSSYSKSEKVTLLKEIEKHKKEKASLQKKCTKLESKDKKKAETIAMNEPVFFDVETIEKMTEIESLGYGAQSEVFKVSREEFFALKKLRVLPRTIETDNANFEKMKKFFSEYEFLSSLNHPNIIKTYGFCLGDSGHSPSILLQFCPYNLTDLVKKLNEIERITIIFEISLAMNKVHESHVIHRDLKPENILLDDQKHVKLSDFGISCLIDPEKQTRSQTGGVGTLLFMAPELLRNSKKYSQKVDVYSFGVVVFYILTNGGYPDISIVDAGSGKKAEIPDCVNKVSRDLISSCWSSEEDDRPSFAQIIELIKRNNFMLIDGIERKIPQIKNFLKV